MPIGRFTKKIQCQLIDCVSTPPATRPTEPPAEATNANTPIALACSRGSGNIVTIIPRITAEVIAPPTPCTKRAATSHDGALSGAAQQRGAGEQGDAREEDAPAADQVADPAREQQQAPERDQVGVHDPREARGREVQVFLDRGQRDVHDRHVEDDHQHPHAQHVQGQPALAAGRCARSRARSRGVARLRAHTRGALGQRLAELVEQLPGPVLALLRGVDRRRGTRPARCSAGASRRPPRRTRRSRPTRSSASSSRCML